MLGLGIVLFLTPLVIRLALRFKITDRPANRKQHRGAVPLLGGLAVFAGVWIPLILLSFWDNNVTRAVSEQQYNLGLIFAGGIAMLALGVVDDVRGLRAKWKFMAQFPAATMLVAGGVVFHQINIPFLGTLELGELDSVVSILWLVGITNAWNLIDGVDGLAAGVGFCVAATCAFLGVQNGQALLAVVMCATAGACLGFLRYNFNPAKIFLGDNGSLFLGITLASTAALQNVKGTVTASFLVPAILLGYPAFDTLLAMIRRLIRGKSMFSGDDGHIHHRLLRKGFSPRQTVLLIYAVCLVFCLWAVAIASRNFYGILACTLGIGLLTISGLKYLGFLDSFRALGSDSDRNHFKALHHSAELAKAKIGMAASSDEVFGLIEGLTLEYAKPAVEIRMPAGPWGPPVQRLWTRPAANGQRRRLAPAAELGTDSYQFDDTGLEIRVYYDPRFAADDLRTEKRSLLGDVCEAANHRLIQLRESPAAVRPSHPRPAVPDTEFAIE